MILVLACSDDTADGAGYGLELGWLIGLPDGPADGMELDCSGDKTDGLELGCSFYSAGGPTIGRPSFELRVHVPVRDRLWTFLQE